MLRLLMRQSLKVFVCDPQPATLSGIERLLTEAGTSLSGTALSPDRCPPGPDRDGPVLFIVDLAPGNVFDTVFIRSLVTEDPTRRVIVYSAYDRLAVVAGVYEAGASAFVSKLAPPQALLDAIEVVQAHARPRDRYFPGDLATALAEFYTKGRRASGSPRGLLTKRQYEIFMLTVEGVPAAEVAERLGMNRRTVGNQLIMIRRALDIPREHFRSYAIEQGLVDPLPRPVISRTGRDDTSASSA